MNLNARELKNMRRYAFMNFAVIATIIAGTGILIAELTHQIWPSFLLVAFLTTAGLIFVPVIYQRALDRLQSIRKFEVPINKN